MLKVTRLMLIAWVILLFTSSGPCAASSSSFSPVTEFSAMRSTQFAKSPASAGDGLENVGASRTYTEAGFGLGGVTSKGSFELEGGIYLFARLLMFEDIWKRVSLSHTRYETFPLALHYTERQYRLELSPKLLLGNNFNMCADIQYDLIRGGSNLWRDKQSSFSYREATESQSYLLKPSLNWNGPLFSSTFYILFLQNIDSISSEFSYQTFGTSSPGLSVGVTTLWSVDRWHMTFEPSLISYQYMFNDPADDFYRRGVTTRLALRLFTGWEWSLVMGFFNDHYYERIMSFDNCQNIAGGSSGSNISRCRRVDHQYLVSPALEFDLSPQTQLSMSYVYSSRVNPNWAVLRQTDHDILLSLEVSPDNSSKGKIGLGRPPLQDNAIRWRPAKGQ